jgi:hypothetical protein
MSLVASIFRVFQEGYSANGTSKLLFQDGELYTNVHSVISQNNLNAKSLLPDGKINSTNLENNRPAFRQTIRPTKNNKKAHVNTNV